MIQGEHGTEGKEQVPVLYKDPYGTAAQDGAHRKLTTVYNYEFYFFLNFFFNLKPGSYPT